MEINQVFDAGKISFFLNPRIFPLPDCTDIMCLIETQRRAGETAQARHQNVESSVLSAYVKACVYSFPLLDMMAYNPSIWEAAAGVVL